MQAREHSPFGRLRARRVAVPQKQNNAARRRRAARDGQCSLRWPTCPVNQGSTTGRVPEPEVFGHVAWPNPDLLLPVPPFGFAMISKMMLSGCVESPANRLAGPGTAGCEAEAAI